MDYTEFTSVKNRFTASPNLCDLFKLLSIETWKRIEYAYLKRGVKVFETTITQNIIFSINAYNDQFPLNIEIFEATDERTNGNDIELIIKYPKEGLEYYAPIQAKKVYRSGKYVSMDHGDQIESLMRYADKKGKPLYLLYNYTPSPIPTPTGFPMPVQLTGCTLIGAEFLFANYYKQRINRSGKETWILPDFYELNPDHAFPWHELVCPDKADDCLNLLQSKGIIKADEIKIMKEQTNKNFEPEIGLYPIGTFLQEKNWINIKNLEFNPDEGLRGSTQMYKIEDSLDSENPIKKKADRKYPVFSPKSRIVINKG
jgi:hypothetical protein